MIDIITNKYIFVPFFGWLIAQALKITIYIIKDRKVNFSHILEAGGMPSSHTAFVISFTTVCARINGLNSFEFGIGFVLSLIVMYDAAGVRRQAGVHAEILNKIMYEHKKINDYGEKLKELLGHTPLQVLAGGALGVLVGLIFT